MKPPSYKGAMDPRVPLIITILTLFIITPAPTDSGGLAISEEVPHLEYQLDYDPQPNITEPFRLILMVTSPGLNLSLFTLRFYMNCTLPGLAGGGTFSTEVAGERGRAEVTLERPFLPFNFTFYLVVVAEGVEVRIPSLSELPVSFSGNVTDTDSDGMDDRWEVTYGLDPTRPVNPKADTDGDGLEDLKEYLSLTSPVLADTDSDGMDDCWEARAGLCPFLDDAGADYDGDGATNYQEYIHRTDPRDPGSVPDLAPPTPWYYVVAIMAIVIILLIYFIAQMVVSRREEEFLTEREDGEDPHRNPKA